MHILLDERLKDHIAEIVGEYPANDVEISVEIGADMQSSRGAVALANSYDNIYAVVGLHPESAESATDKDIEEIAILAKNKKVVAIGEIGLDYHYDYDKTIQKSVLNQTNYDLADKLNLPIVIHLRDAYQDMENIFCRVQKLYK